MAYRKKKGIENNHHLFVNYGWKNLVKNISVSKTSMQLQLMPKSDLKCFKIISITVAAFLLLLILSRLLFSRE